jgi:hypothetical protein
MPDININFYKGRFLQRANCALDCEKLTGSVSIVSRLTVQFLGAVVTVYVTLFVCSPGDYATSNTDGNLFPLLSFVRRFPSVVRSPRKLVCRIGKISNFGPCNLLPPRPSVHPSLY